MSLTEEKFRKNRIECAFATSDNKCTLGFASSGRPKSLMKSNALSDKAQKVDLVFRKPRGYKGQFELYYGDQGKLVEYLEEIEEYI